MKTFIKHDFPKLVQQNSEGGRTYLTPTGKAYPSVTTVVSPHKAQFIQEWRNRVGHEEANKISARASKRGTAVHALCEQYLLTGSATPEMYDREVFEAIRPHLDMIDNIHCLETQLYSHHLQVAGTVDLIAEYNGKLCIIDFKTSRRSKDIDDIHDYFMQTSAYAVMFEELTGLPVNRLLIIMGVDGEDEASVFYQKRDDWIQEFIKLRIEYKKQRGV